MVKREMKVTPYDVRGKIDYDRLINEFGLERITDNILKRIEKHAGEMHFMLRRKIFFAGRDLKWVLDEYEKGNKFFLYTGRGPSGPIHLGHLGTWIFAKWLQDKFGAELWFQFTDDEKFLLGKNESMEEVQKWMYENMLDIIALGFDPKKTYFLVDTKHAGMIYPEAIKVAKRITYSMVKSSFGFNESTNIGLIFFTSVQAVPAFLPSVLKKKKIPCLIPHAIDQDTHFRITRDILPKLGYRKPASIQNSFLTPLSGPEGKMSSSKSSGAILTTDSPKEVERKVKKYAFSGGQKTTKDHREKGGNPDVDVAYQWLNYFLEEDDRKLQEIYEKYESGEMLTSELKEILIDKINAFLKEHQKKREKAKKIVDDFIYK
ncbi:tryptophan--tRNA ligase [Candidatus Pacearchaeota archaeon]|nr:tryptophan--tRNA ligase [Candidatus Pacearchaeota archaeon]|tara:strand:+ start:880 stop:2004 length:1125 start_codon:yes stop_codon:yes gene_type:complete